MFNVYINESRNDPKKVQYIQSYVQIYEFAQNEIRKDYSTNE